MPVMSDSTSFYSCPMLLSRCLQRLVVHVMLTRSHAGCALYSMLQSICTCQASLHLPQSALACLVQNDLHSPQATIKEALWFSARLRLGPEVSNKVMWGFIYQVGAALYLARPMFGWKCCILPAYSIFCFQHRCGHLDAWSPP